MALCPVCLTKNIESVLINIGVDNIILTCENEYCTFLQDTDNFKILNFDSKLNSCLYKNEKDDHDIILREESKDLDIDLSSTASENEDALTVKCKTNCSKYTVKSVHRHLKNIVKNAYKEPPIFNWFGSPIMMKFHIKACYLLVIQLRMFDCLKIPNIRKLKEQYYKYENMVSKVPKRLLSLISYKFLKFLYDNQNSFKLANLNCYNMSERILKSMERFVSTTESPELYRSVYHCKQVCKSCEFKWSYLKEDISIKIPNKNFQYKNNEFTFEFECKKCFEISDISIKIERLAKFIFLDLSNGTDNSFTELNEMVFPMSPDNDLKLQAIIEFKCPPPIIDVPEKEPKVHEFVMKNLCRQIIDYRISFQNTDGWFSINPSSGYLLKPMAASDIEICNSNVRLVMFSECNEPRDSFCDIDRLISLHEELEEYKIAPKDFIKYPSDIVKYWIFLFKHRDHCLLNSDLSPPFLLEMATKITDKLNDHLTRREKRIKRKMRRADKRKEKGSLKTKHNNSSDEEDFVSDYTGDDDGHDSNGQKQSGNHLSQISFCDLRSTVVNDSKSRSTVKEENTNDGIYGASSLTIDKCRNGTKSNLKVETTAAVIPDSNENCQNIIFNLLKQKTEMLARSRINQSNSNEPLLDELIQFKKRKLEERN